MLSPTKAHSGKTLTMMDMATTNSLHSKEMLVLTHTEPVSKIDLDALMEMEMDIQTKETHSLLTKTNGQTPILTEGERNVQHPATTRLAKLDVRKLFVHRVCETMCDRVLDLGLAEGGCDLKLDELIETGVLSQVVAMHELGAVLNLTPGREEEEREEKKRF